MNDWYYKKIKLNQITYSFKVQFFNFLTINAYQQITGILNKKYVHVVRKFGNISRCNGFHETKRLKQ